MAFLRLLGNKVIAGGYLPWAQTKLSQLRRLLAIQGNDVGMRRYSLVDADILVTKNFLVENIIITGKGGVGIPVLFLITSPTEYVGWNVIRDSDGVVTLTPKSIIFPDIAELHSGLPLNWPSTVKSSSDYSKHRFVIADVPVVPGAYLDSNNNYGQYGLYYEKDTTWQYFYNGMSSGWQPKDFSPNSSVVWEEQWSGGYICSSRHPFQTYPNPSDPENNLILKNLRFIKTATGVGQIEYDTKDGHQIGPSFNYSSQQHIYAVLNKDKIIGGDFSTYNTVETDTTTSEQIYDPDGNCYGNPYYIYSGEYSGGDIYDGFKFGDVVLDTDIGYFKRWGGSSSKISCGCRDKFAYGIITTYWRYISIAGNESMINMMDYDNLNGDETFICFYRKKDGYQTDEKYQQIGYPSRYNGYGAIGDKAIFWMAYRINNGALVKVEVCSLTSGDYGTYGTLQYNDYCPNWGIGCQIPSYPPTNTSGFRGTRMSDVSCQVTSKYIFYSYVLQTYNGPPGTDHWFDDDNVLWDFSSRILGIIDIATGKRTEHTVNDDLLGKLYKDTFDKTKAAAIGWHKEGG